ncbi:MAG TPA: putative PEP-binding protein [Solirubrobacteraceae bacterium]|nr:putative PEP-binding protein [Solirubrobacteraceae bacterium]
MGERVLAGSAASPGVAIGAARPAVAPQPVAPSEIAVAGRGHEGLRATAALEAAAAELAALAARLLAEGRGDEAELVGTAVLLAGDPGLRENVLQRTAAGAPAVVALTCAAEAQAALIAAIDDPLLAARADDVRSVGRRAARLAVPADVAAEDDDAELILVADDLGPADVAELHPGVRGIALARGSVSAHAAIVARSLGLPMVVGLGPAILDAGGLVVLDGDEGTVVVEPGSARAGRARAAAERRTREHRRWTAERALPARTRDGHRIEVLANVAGEAEVAVALGYGAEGAGLVRTELSFLDAEAWPTEDEHLAALRPLLGALRGQVATVRVLDFGADKTPPFLAGAEARGLALLLRSPDALAAQLRAVLRAGRDCRLRVLLPMVEGSRELEEAAALLRRAAEDTGSAVPPLGAMVETPAAAAAVFDLAGRADFLSIGTNDLTCATLGVDRFGAGTACAHDPRVLELIARTVRAAHAAGRTVEVCGEAASDPRTLALLVGLGVDELSVGAARVGEVRARVRDLDRAAAGALAARALQATDAAGVEALVQAGDAAAERFDRGDRVSAVRA